MAVQNGGISGYAERTMLSAFFSATSFSTPATVYVGLSISAPIDISNFGSSISYGVSTLVDSTGPFLGLNLAGAYITTPTSTAVVLTNSATTLNLATGWTGGTPTAGDQFDLALFNEPTGNNYSRLSFANDDTEFSPLPSRYPSGGFVTVNPPLVFPIPSGGGWGHIVSMFLADSATTGRGRLLGAQPLAVPQNVLGGQSLTIPANAFNLGLK